MEEMERFAIGGAVAVGPGQGGLTRIAVDVPEARSEVYLHGGHLTAWRPAGHEDVIFTSQRSFYKAGKAIRGGIPMIFPWFGPHPTRKEAPQHGFARTREWQLRATGSASGVAAIELGLEPDASSRDFWHSDFEILYTIGIGAQLSLELEIVNRSPAPFTCEAALHTYLVVGDVRKISIEGLAGREYLDKTRAMSRNRQEGDVRLTEETDRVYLGTTDTVIVHDPVMDRRLLIAKEGSASTVVWNPWSTKGDQMADMAPGEWSRFVCVETTNAAEDARTIPPGGRHQLSAVISVERGTGR